MVALAHDWLVAGVDLGGTRTKLSFIGPDDRVIESAILPPHPRVADDMIASLVDGLSGVPVRALGVSLPGFVDRDFGSRELPGKLPGLSGRDLVGELGGRLEVPVTCLNDGQAAAIGEWRAGAGQGHDDLLVLTLGTGVGSGVILDGRPLSGGRLGVGNGVGHWSLDVNGDRCLCGNVGCPETRISGPAMVAAARGHLERGVPSTLTRGFADLHFETIAAAAAEGDELGTTLIDRFIRDLGVTLTSGAQAYGVGAVVVAGGMAAAVRAYAPRLQRFVEAHTWRYPTNRPIPVLIAALGDFSGSVGAGLEAADLARAGGHRPVAALDT
jgi:glucokinase